MRWGARGDVGLLLWGDVGSAVTTQGNAGSPEDVGAQRAGAEPRAKRHSRSGRGPVAGLQEAAFVAVAAAVIIVAVRRLPPAAPLDTASVVLAVGAAVGATGAAVLWTAVARFTCDGRAAWGGAALGVYGLLAVPATIIGSTVDSAEPATAAIRLVVYVSAAVMSLLASTRVVKVAPRCSGHVMGIGAIVAVAAGGSAVLAQHAGLPGSMWTPTEWVVVALWALAGAGVACRGAALGVRPGFRAGLGVILLAFSHGYLMHGGPRAGSSVELTFNALRVLAVGIVLGGAVQQVRRGLRALRQVRAEQREQLVMAELGLERLAVREHELRNGIAGIAGAAAVLNGTVDDHDQACLRRALAAEMARLEALLTVPAREVGAVRTAEPAQVARPVRSRLRKADTCPARRMSA